MPHSATGRPEGQIRQFRAFRFGDVPLPGTSRRALLPAALSPLTTAHAAAIHAAHTLATTHTLAAHATLTLTAVAAMMVMFAAAAVIVRTVTGGQRQGQTGSESQSKNLFHKMLHQQCFSAEDAR
ncbi:hypothetical protein AD929_10510 [Gluconobacter potus]|uniref:Uncharacterized protein n=1 Tax=Gluconobacter potus TaxID=2724927 RepID=A0A149QT01_9PROT|nr:hypothetical protein AD929_10510 [Gluconobacter potus]